MPKLLCICTAPRGLDLAAIDSLAKKLDSLVNVVA
jgi:hypothetical protein